MNKQLLPFLLTVCLLSLFGVNAFAHDIEVANADGVMIYYLKKTNSELAVTFRGPYSSSYVNEYSGNVVIPGTVDYNGDTYSVTSIGGEAFSNCPGLISVIIPISVTSISGQAFYSCSGLKSVTIPNSVTYIGESAFQGCNHLTSLTIGSGVTSIGNYAFNYTNLKKTIWLTNTPPSGYNNANVKGALNYVSNDQFSSLYNVKIYQFLSSIFEVDGIKYVPISPSERTCDAIDCVYNESAVNTKISSTISYKGITMTVKNIQPYIAYNNKYIMTLTVDNEGEIPDCGFTNCFNITNVSLGHKISAIGRYAFQGCFSIEKIEIPEVVNVLNDYAFYSCSSLKEIKIGSKVNTINQYAFSGCSSLPSISIPQSVTTIDNYVFDNCTNLKNVIIEDCENDLNLGSNGNNPLFNSCPLDYVYIGRNINYNKTSSYGYSPFYRNTSLSAVEITDKETEISDNEFYGCTNLQRVKIGDGITTIGNWAFSGCQSLQYFAFGSQVANIGQEAFSDCTSVVEITSKATTPPVCGTQALNDINKWDCKLYVPEGCMSAYTSAYQWKEFFFSEEGSGTAEQNPEGQPETGKCEKPTISIVDGKIHFTCATDGVSYTYYVTATNPSGVGNDINPSSLTLTVYASKPGFETSDAATIEFAAPNGLKGDLNNDGIVNVADHVELSNIILK